MALIEGVFMKTVAGLVFVCLILTLGACGGGGGPSPSSSSGNSQTRLVEPSVPQSDYSGSITPATVDSSDAVGLMQDVFIASDFLQENQSTLNINETPQTYDTTQTSSNGGTVTIKGVIQQDGSGWLENIYSNYMPSNSSGNLTLNGTVVIYLDKPVNGQSISGTLGMSNYKMQQYGSVDVYQGNMKYANGTNTANITVHDQGTGNVFAMVNFKITPGTNGLSTVTGKVADSGYGEITVATPQPFQVQYGPNDTSVPIYLPGGSSGELTATGANGSELAVEPLNDAFVWLGLDTTGSGVFTTGARIDRTTGDIDATPPMSSSALAPPMNGSRSVPPVNNSPSAVIELPSAVTHSQPVSVDGRFSYAPGSLVNYSWSLASVPPGSAAALASTTGPETSFTPDLTGTYMLKLTVGDSQGSATSEFPVNFSGGDTYVLSSPATVYAVPGNITASVGETVTLDGRASLVTQYPFNSNPGPVPFSWSLITPPGSNASLDNPSVPVVHFTPDVPGLYYAILSAPSGLMPLNSTPRSAASIITVGSEPNFAPAEVITDTNLWSPTIGAATLSPGSPAGLALLDTTPGSPASYSLDLWPSSGSGIFGNQQSYALPTFVDGLYTGDLNGDGITDFAFDTYNAGVGTDPSGAVVALSGSGGYTTTMLSYTHCGTYGNRNPEKLAVGNINGTPGVVLVDECYTSTSSPSALVTYLMNNQGQFGTAQYSLIPPMTYASGDQIVSMALGNLTGNGNTDLAAILKSPAASSAQLLIFLGNGDGTFSFSQSFTIPDSSGYAASLAIGDWNSDGYPDIAVSASPSSAPQLELYYGDGTGQFGNPVSMSLPNQPVTLIPVDLNGDGYTDLLGASPGPGIFTTYFLLDMLMNSASGLQSMQTYPVLSDSMGYDSWPNTASLAVGKSSSGALQRVLMNFQGTLVDLEATPPASAPTHRGLRRNQFETRLPAVQKRNFWLSKPGAHLIIPKLDKLLSH